MQVARRLPLALTALRALLGPVLLLQAWAGPAPRLFAACLVAAFLSDVFDGIVARRLGIATAGLRRLDSLADTVFYVCATAAVARLQPGVIAHHATALLVLLALELLRYAYDLRKFGREAAYHMLSSKAWGVALFAGFGSLLVLGRDGWAVDLAIGLGIVADLEGLAISWVLPAWRADVPSIVHALRLRARA